MLLHNGSFIFPFVNVVIDIESQHYLYNTTELKCKYQLKKKHVHSINYPLF